MIIIRLKGGLGNQMFQYAFGLGMAEKLQTKLALDLTSLLDRSKGNDFVYRNFDLSIFHIQENFVLNPGVVGMLAHLKSSLITRWLRGLVDGGRGFIRETQFQVMEQLLDNPVDNAVYEGWWQSEKYFAHISGRLRQDFSFRSPPLPASLPLLERIKSSNSICLNVRRTDFLKVDNLNTTNLDYFLQAADYLCKRVPDPTFYIFSDDLAWCAENIQLKSPIVWVGHDMKGVKFGNYLRLMSACKHFIIPNSSFAWWAVWLNDNPDRMVVAPEKWFNDQAINTSDLVPKEWIRL